MAETLGMLMDRLGVANLKMWQCQEVLYEIRRFTFEEFMTKYYSEDGMKILFDIFKKACDLNYQRNQLIDEIDKTVVTMIKDGVDKKDLDKYIQLKHKTY